METKILKDNQAVAEAFASYFENWLQNKDRVVVALSGGSTPKALFQHWTQNYREKIPWGKIHFFWGDERCVSSDDPESNYGLTKNLLFDHIAIPAENIHRIRGEAEPEAEAIRYGHEIAECTPVEHGLPVFDLIILGMGADGHTASIFPDQLNLLHDQRICAVATHPESGQLRVTLTGPVLNNARLVIFLVTGKAKAGVIEEIFDQKGAWDTYPAAHIHPQAGQLIWFLDEEAARGGA